jgi:hypothetical protein
MICPYCLTRNSINGNQCSNPQCRKNIPPLYLKYHGKKGSDDPVLVSVVGFSGHGKTVFLGALFSFIDNQLPRVWKGFSRQGLNQEGIDALDTVVKQLGAGVLPAPTPRTFPDPSIHRFWKLPKFGDQTLVIYDPPGEAFSAGDNVERYAGFVRQSRCVLFLISLSDLKRFVASEMHRLLETYQLGLSRMSGLPRAQHLIVVFTKADLLSGEFQLSPALREVLINKGAQQLVKPGDYLNSLKEYSDLLRDFTANTLGAQNFINLAKQYFHSVEYTVISSTGSNPENGRLTTALLPSRVFDPLLWVLAKEKGWLARHHRALKRGAFTLVIVLILFTGYLLGGSLISRRRLGQDFNSANVRKIDNPEGQVTLRRTPGKKDSPGDVIATLDAGVTVEALNIVQLYRDGTVWEKVRYNSQEGWVNQRFLRPSASTFVSPPTSFNKAFEGSINKRFGLDLRLERNGNSIKGTGTYKTKGIPFPVQGTIDPDGNFNIGEFANDNQRSGSYRGRMLTLVGSNQSKMEGTWSDSNEIQSYSFVLVEK